MYVGGNRSPGGNLCAVSSPSLAITDQYLTGADVNFEHRCSDTIDPEEYFEGRFLVKLISRVDRLRVDQYSTRDIFSETNNPLGEPITDVLSILLLLRSAMTIQTLRPWYSTKLVVFLRSSAVRQSLVFRAVGSGQKCCRLDMLRQVCRICSGVCSLSPHSQSMSAGAGGACNVLCWVDRPICDLGVSL
jgi:hypothetical protein